MEEKILIYQPATKARLKKSALYALPMFTKSISLCSQYLLQSLRKKHSHVEITDEYIKKFWHLHFGAAFASLYVSGRSVLRPNQPYIFMSNHGSWMDIPAMFGAVPGSLRMISKIGLMQLPVVGHAMANAGFIAVDRKNRSRAIRQLSHAKHRLAEGISIWMSPEGTRSRDGSIGNFKKGGFYLAKELNMPIVPVYIEGAIEVMPADGLMVYPNRSITVHFCTPVTADEVAHLGNNELMKVVRDRIIEKKLVCLGNSVGENNESA